MMLSDRDTALLARAVEGALSPAEQKDLARLLRENPGLEKELDQMKRLKEVTVELKFKQPAGETWDRYWAGVYARLERGLAWLLISVGAILLFAAAGYTALIEFFSDTTVPLPVRIGAGALLMGLAVLLVSVLREKWILRKSDKYREVVR